MKKLRIITTFLLFFFTGYSAMEAQMITGIWRGKINKQKVEVKIIQKDGSLTGTSYYYESADNYLRYSIKGYFDPGTNEVVWWDDQFIERAGGISSPGKVPLLSRTDFNCPGYGRMILGGRASRPENQYERAGEVNLEKTDWSNFSDEWDFVIENYTVGANDPDIIDSIGSISSVKRPAGEETINNNNPLGNEITEPPVTIHLPDLPIEEPKTNITAIKPTEPSIIEEKFLKRKKVFATEIPVSGDSIELRFYDNAQIDGDSISLFLNDRLIFQHIRLTDKAYTIKLPVTALNASNELIMVAENLGSIPPNTSFMVAVVGDKQYEARLESTEGSSAMIRLVRKDEKQ